MIKILFVGTDLFIMVTFLFWWEFLYPLFEHWPQIIFRGRWFEMQMFEINYRWLTAGYLKKIDHFINKELIF